MPNHTQADHAATEALVAFGRRLTNAVLEVLDATDTTTTAVTPEIVAVALVHVAARGAAGYAAYAAGSHEADRSRIVETLTTEFRQATMSYLTTLEPRP